MANQCFFKIKVVGEEENVKQFIGTVKERSSYGFVVGQQLKHFPGITEILSEELRPIDSNGNSYFMAEGHCDWSVAVSMTNIGHYKNGKKRYGESFNATTLEIESKLLNLDIEVYSSEEGFQFQEHFLYKKGKVIKEECVDWMSCTVQDLVCFGEEPKTTVIELGGFGEWAFEI